MAHKTPKWYRVDLATGHIKRVSGVQVRQAARVMTDNPDAWIVIGRFHGSSLDVFSREQCLTEDEKARLEGSKNE